MYIPSTSRKTAAQPCDFAMPPTQTRNKDKFSMSRSVAAGCYGAILKSPAGATCNDTPTV